MGQQPLEVEVHINAGRPRSPGPSIGHDERAQTLHHLREHVGGHEQSLNNSARRCAHTVLIFSPPEIAMLIVDARWKRLIQQEVT